MSLRPLALDASTAGPSSPVCRPELIVIGARSPDMASLVSAAAAPIAALPDGVPPLVGLTGLLADEPVDTLHLVAHGRPDGLELAGQWIDADALEQAAGLLAQWSVRRIALWSCRLGVDGRLVDTLGRLTGAEVLAADGPLGRVGDAAEWLLSSHRSDGGAVSGLHGSRVFGAAATAAWPHQLGLLTVSFSSGFVGDNGGTNSALAVSSFADLGWTGVQFAQNSATSIFTAQGNDIIGSVLITDFNGVEHELSGFVKWRTPSGNSPSTLVFQPDAGTNLSLTTNSAGVWGLNSYAINSVVYVGLTFNGSSLSFNEGDDVTGNAATSGLLDVLNAYLAAQPQLSVGDISVNEGDGTITFTVSLSTTSSDTVTVKFDTADGSATAGSDYTAISSGSLSFAPGQTSKTVSVTVTDDAAAESAETIQLVLRDPAFAAIADATGVATMADNDSTGSLVLGAASGHTSEGGQSASFSVRLSAQPSASVTVSVASDDAGEGTVSPVSLTFTTANWNTPQTVTVAGVDDNAIDGAISYAAQLSSTSSDAAFDGRTGTVNLVNDDNDSAALTVGSISRHTTEGGQTATFSVQLSSQPTSNVTVSVASNDSGEGQAGPASLTFTPANWNSGQTVTVTGADDAQIDGNVSYAVDLAATSSDTDYQGRTASVTVVNDDNDSASLTLGSISRHTTEGGQTATFSVQLSSQPTSNVTVSVASNDSGEGQAGPASLTFTPGNWSTAQTVTVTGADDDQVDGAVGYAVNLSSTSGDGHYDGLSGSVSVTNDDNDSASLVTGAAAAHTTEGGVTTTFTVRLASQPSANVTVAVASSDSGEGTLGPASLVFTPSDWNVDQTVTATGVDDSGIDGAATYNAQLAATSSDPHYDGVTGSVGLVNDDDDSAGITLSATSLETDESGPSVTFTARLSSQPTADVTLAVSSSDLTEGQAGPSSLTFTPANWNTPQTVTVQGVDDADIDGDIGWFVQLAASSEDTGFQGASGAVAVVTADDDSATLVISGGDLQTSELGLDDTLVVRLGSRPEAPVTVTLVSSRPGEARAASDTLTFTPDNWNTPRSVSILGVDDDLVDGPSGYVVTLASSSTDPHYQGLAATVQGVNADNDHAQLVFSSELLNTTENGDTATLTVQLSSRPTGPVSVSGLVGDSSEGTLSAGPWVFTPDNWNQPRSLTVTGVDDALVDGTMRYPLVFSSSSGDPSYNALSHAVTVDNADNDRPALLLGSSQLTTGEGGQSDTLTVRLATQPTAPVTVTLTTSNGGEGRVTTLTLTFTPDNWNQPQPVVIQGLDDPEADGDAAYQVELRTTSTDPNYAGLDAGVPVRNVDDDVAGTVGVVGGDVLHTSEDGSGDRFVLHLSSRPLAPVTLTLHASDGGEGRTEPATLTFTPDNWDQDQSIQLLGVDDPVVDGPVSWTLQLDTRSSDPAYDGLRFERAVSNADNDQVSTSTQPVFDLGQGPAPQAGDTARLLDPAGRVIAGVVVTPEQAAQGSVVVTPPSMDDGTYTFMVQVLDPEGQLRGEYPLTVTVVTDRDGLMPSVESAAHGGDFNADGVADWQQNNVGQLPLRSLADFQAGRLAPESAFGAVMAGAPAADGGPVQLDPGAQLLDLGLMAAPPGSLPAGLAAASDVMRVTVASQAGRNWADADPSQVGHQSVISIDLPFGVDANEVLLWSPAANGWQSALAASGASGGSGGGSSGAGLARLFDTDHDGHVDRLVLTLTDGGFGDADGQANGSVTSGAMLAQRLAEPVYSVLLASGDRYLTTDAAAAAQQASGTGNRYEGVWFDSLPAAAGGQPLQAWEQPFTGDRTWALAGQALPYACYQPVAGSGLMAAPASAGLGTEVHLFLDAAGRTQLFPVAAAASLGLVAGGYRDLGAAFRTTTDTAQPFDPEGYLVANRSDDSVQALVKDLSARFTSSADPAFVDAVEHHFLTQVALVGLPQGDAADVAALNAAFGTHFGA